MRSSRPWKLLLAAPLLAAPAFTAVGCEGSGEDCLTARQYLETQVWPTFMGNTCLKCHHPSGVAVAESKAKFVLQPSSFPGFMEANLKMLEEISRVDVDGTPLLLVKPIGGNNHGGGEVLEKDGEEYKALEKLVQKLKEPPSCGEDGEPTVEGLVLMTPAQTFRKAAIHLAGRLPTAAEAEKVTSEESLDEALDGLMKEDVFLDRVREMYNDAILTDKYDWYGDGLNLINEEDFPKVNEIQDADQYAPIRRKASRAIAREPLNLVAYVVQQDRPIKEILTANYVVANPFSGQLYDVTGWSNPENENEFKEVQLKTYDGTEIPHAGILTTPAFLNRWPTTPTNRSRGRARQVFESFLAFNVLKISERPVDASKITAVDNPTMNSVYCAVCHTTIDPLAGAFRGWSENGDYTKFYPGAEWHNDMVSAGYGSEDMPPQFYDKGLQWMAGELVDDPRFAISTVYTVYTGITGHQPLSYPSDPEADGYAGQLVAWDAQDAFFRATADQLVKSGWNLKSVVKAVIKSPYFRGVGAGNPSVEQLADIGTGRLLPPEMMNRKIRAITGVYWGYFDGDGYRRDWLARETYQNYFILYGGMDSNSVVKHLKTPNGTVAAVSNRMANELSCGLTAWDFTKEAAGRRFFPRVERTVVPESAGNTVPASVSLIKENIAYLHHLILGEQLAPEDPEVDRTYKVFLETWHEMQATEDTQLPWWCRGRWDPSTGNDLPEAIHINEDPDGTIRAWQAVMAYLMMDYKFIFE